MPKTTVTRTEQIHLPPNSKLSRLCHQSKNLYNQANYTIRQTLFKTGKWIRYWELAAALKNSQSYRALPTQTAQQTLKNLDRNWKSFLRATKKWKKRPDRFLGKTKTPRYKEKNGEHLLIFTNQQYKIKEGEIKFPKKADLRVKTRLGNGTRPREVRIVPRGWGYVLEVVYRKSGEPLKPELDRSRVAGLDLGMRNTVTIANNIGLEPIVFKGGVLKSINQYYNRKRARLQSIHQRQKARSGPRLQKLTQKRSRKIGDLFHKLSRRIVEWCIKHGVGVLVVGYNQGWKQGSKSGAEEQPELRPDTLPPADAPDPLQSGGSGNNGGEAGGEPHL